ncbi:MAG TPA: hypothetical protein VFA37_03285 [Gaiellaceae bacterium]|nr:hypothetical protein [Gaiellaceae bacterium]
MSERLEEQIRFGLRLLADEVQPPAATRVAFGKPRLLAVAAALVVIAGAVLGIVDRSGPSAGPRFLADAFDYRQGGVSYKPGGVSPGNGPVPLYETAQLSAVSAASRDAAWIVGSVAWRWEGTAWRKVSFPNVGMGALMSVATIGPRNAWATGPTGDGYLLHSRAVIENWNGATWTAARVPGLGPTDLFAISAAGADDVWAAGATYRSNRLGRLNPRATQPLLLHWDGAAWRRVALPWERPGVVVDRLAATPTGVWAVASGQEEEMPKHVGPAILVEYWNGERWQSVRAPFGPSDPIAGFGATSGQDAWAVGSYAEGGLPEYDASYSHPLAAHWNGERWQVAPVPDLPGHNDSALLDVVAVRPGDAWALGVSEHLTVTKQGFGATIEATQPVALVERWDGRRWRVTSGSTPEVWGGVGAYDLGLTVAKDGAAWAIVKNYCDNVVIRWTGSAWTVDPHPRDRQWRPGLPLRIRRRGLPRCATAARP